VVHRLGYLARLLLVPLLCVAVALVAFNRAGARDRAGAEAARV
jgi:hypothetical protein